MTVSVCDGLPPQIGAKLQNDARLTRKTADAAVWFKTKCQHVSVIDRPPGRGLAALWIHDLLCHCGNKVLRVHGRWWYGTSSYTLNTLLLIFADFNFLPKLSLDINKIKRGKKWETRLCEVVHVESVVFSGVTFYFPGWWHAVCIADYP